MSLEDLARDRVYTRCARAVSEAGSEREAMLLARLVLLLCERVGNEEQCMAAIGEALDGLPYPSLSRTDGLNFGSSHAGGAA